MKRCLTPLLAVPFVLVLFEVSCTRAPCSANSCGDGCCWENVCYEGTEVKGGASCGTDPLSPRDAGERADGGMVDAESPDAGAPDAGTPDAGGGCGISGAACNTQFPCCSSHECRTERCVRCEAVGNECDATGGTRTCCGPLECALKPGFNTVSSCQVDDGGLRYDPNIDCVGEGSHCGTKNCCTHNDGGVALSRNDYRCQRVDCVKYAGFCADGITPPCCDVQSSSESRTCFQTRCERCYRKGALCWNTGTDYPCCSGAPCPGPSGSFGYCP